ncbi:MAG: DUF1015 family protein [Acidimicrobiales bacterium]
MPRFAPFRGLRYAESLDLEAVTSPPYDVIDEAERIELTRRSPHNAVRLDLPRDGEGQEPYRGAARLLSAWREQGLLVPDDAPALYLYRMGYRGPAGRPRQISGVVGALEVAEPGDGQVLPHERTTPKPRGDRLELLRATRHNLSPIWCLSLATGLAGLCEPAGPPLGRCTDPQGVHHRLWRVASAALIEAIGDVVASAPALIADGHHRFESARVYRDERRAVGAGWCPASELVMAMVVELADARLSVRPIHRLLLDLPPDLDVVAALAPFFEPVGPVDPAGPSLEARMDDAGALGVVVPGGRAWLLRPRAGAFPDDLADLDASRLEAALPALPPHGVSYEHDTGRVLDHVAGGRCSAGLLLRPATVSQIAATASHGDRLPPKTTYFAPKPRTGMVFRSLDLG